MNRRGFLHSSAGAAALGGARGAATRNPNIVVILADDFGYGSVNCYGADRRHVRTPAMDRLAREGVRFTDANTPSSVCTPSRYGLLTGRYCWRTSLKYGVLGITSPLHIERSRPTLASLVKARGYSTAAIGKWHLGYGTGATNYAEALTPGPLDIGFDYHFAVPQNHGDATGVFVEDRAVVGLRSKRIEAFGRTPYGRPFMGIDAPHRVDESVMETLTDRAVSWIERQKAERPFFLYFTPVAVHEPTTPSPRTRGTSGAGPYGDYIHDLDLSAGRVLDALDRQGFAGDTLVVFTSDNGGVLMTEGDRPEAEAYRAGLRVNGDWRGRKHSIYQGGFRVPFLLRWPGKSPAGTINGETVNLVDLFATLAAAAGSPLPPVTQAGEDSFNVLPAFLGRKAGKPLRDSLIVHNVDGVFAIRQGEWKYVEGKADAAAKKIPEWRKLEMTPQLYNLRDDPGEQKNLLERHGDVASRMADLLSTHRSRTHSATR